MMIKQLIQLVVSTFIFRSLSGAILQAKLLAFGSERWGENGRVLPTTKTRQQTEQAILGATVRFEMETRVGCENGTYSQRDANGHGTVINGRYLLTHNHLDETITDRLRTGISPQPITITLYDIHGQILAKLPAKQLTVAAVASETLVLDFGCQDNLGFFQARGLPSAPFMVATDLRLKAGTQVAQVNWDGTTTCIKWVIVEATKTISGTPVVQLSDKIGQGASGGGVYWNGVHIGNNWKTSIDTTTSLETAKRYSHAALNAPQIMDLKWQ